LCYLEEVFGEVTEHGVDGKVMQPGMFCPLVVVVVDEVLNVVVRPDVLYVLQTKQYSRQIFLPFLPM